MCNQDRTKVTQNESEQNKIPSSRREFMASVGRTMAVSASVLAGSKISFANSFLPAAGVAPESREPRHHYFLHIQLDGGLDSQYLFDARPLEFTEKKLLVNYYGKDPILYTGKNGQASYRTDLVEPLMRWSSRFAVLNGVVMGPTFEGHDQGLNVLMTGNAFGGASYLPMTNMDGRFLDYIQTGRVFSGAFTNTGGSMELSPSVCRQLASQIKAIAGKRHVLAASDRQAQTVGGRNSSLGLSSRQLRAAYAGIPDFATRLSNVEISESSPSSGQNSDSLIKNTKANVQLFTEIVRVGVANAGFLVINEDLDTHGASSAKALPNIVSKISEALAAVFEHLHTTPSPSGRSMLDDTTIIIGTEFSRTMRQQSGDFEQMGTDHNPLNNTIILAGKGVKGGQVIGASDFSTTTENLSKAHLALDPAKIKLMGLPFDYATSQVLADVRLETYDPARYITAMSVNNTIQEIAGIPADKRVTFGRGLPVVPSIKAVIA